MNQQFAGYVTRVAFNISLSRSQIATLAHIAERSRRPNDIPVAEELTFPSPGNFIPSVRSLVDRGLVEYTPLKTKVRPGWTSHPLIVSGQPWSYSLTRAGELVVELLKEAGIVQITERTQRRKAA